MKLEQLKTFILLDKVKTMTATADELGVSVMAVSKKIKLLEQSIGSPLFLRSRRELVLTEFGECFRKKVTDLLERFDNLDAWVKAQSGEITGTVRILAQFPEMLKDTIIPFLTEFNSLYPKLAIELDVKESLIDIRVDDYDIFWGVSDYLGEKFPDLKRRTLWVCDYGRCYLLLSKIGVVSSAVFGMCHAYQGVASAIKTAAVGVVFGLTYWLSDNLLNAILLHIIFDIYAGTSSYIAIRHDKQLDLPKKQTVV